LSQSLFEATEILRGLHRKVGSPDFELRVQALFAHILLRLGWSVRQLNHPGHPDVLVETSHGMLKFEVEVLSQAPYQVKEDDLEALRAKTVGWCGYLALLDCGPPLLWLVLPYEVVQGQAGKSLHKPEIKRLSAPQLSSKCTEEFCSLLCLNKQKLENLTFSLLRKWALDGKNL